MSRYERYTDLKIEVADKVATVTLNRPEARNAINQRLIRELRSIWDDLADDMAVSAVLVTGAGPIFSVGGDVKAMSERPGGDVLEEGEVQLLITTPSGAMNEFIQQKRLKLLAVTSPEPSPLAPGTPTIGATLPGYAAESWFAIIGPAGMPADQVGRLNAATSNAVMAPEIQERFRTFGVVAKTTTPQKLTQMVADEVARWTPVIRDNNIRTD